MNNKSNTILARKYRGQNEEKVQKFLEYKFLLNFIKGIHKDPNALDLGAGDCVISETIANCGFKVQAVDAIESLPSAEYLKQNYFIKSDVINYLKENNHKKFELITLIHLIEHIEISKYCELIENLYNMIADDGVLIIETPNLESIMVSNLNFYADPTHLRLVHREYLTDILFKSGFTDVRVYDKSPLDGNGLDKGFLTIGQDLVLIAFKGVKSRELFISINFPKLNYLHDSINNIERKLSYIDRLSQKVEFLENELMDLRSSMLVKRKNSNKIYIIKNLIKKIAFFCVRWVLQHPRLKSKLLKYLLKSSILTRLKNKAVNSYRNANIEKYNNNTQNDMSKLVIKILKQGR